MKTPNLSMLALFAATGLAAASIGNAVFAHGNVLPQPVDTTALPDIGEAWLVKNPYRGNATAIKIGESAYGQNCARCHGLEAMSGGIAPDLRYLDVAEAGDVSPAAGLDYVVLPREILPPKVRFTFALKVANFLSPATSTTVTVVQKASLPAPHALIQGDDPKTTTRDEKLRLVLTADQPNLCDGLSLAERRMVIEWRENTGQFVADGGRRNP